MSDALAEKICNRMTALEGGRATFDNMFQQIAERVLPGSATFRTVRTPGEERTEKMLDATAALAVRKFATILEAISMPRGQQWHRLVPAEEALKKVRAVKLYMDELNDVLFRYRYAPSANFTGQTGAMFLEGSAFGTAPLFVDEEPGSGIRYRAFALAESYFAENHVGLFDTFYRRFQWSARQAALKWGKDNLPAAIKVAADKNPDNLFSFVHCIQPNTEPNPSAGVRKDFEFASYTVSETGAQTVQQSGFYSWPLPYFRDLTAAGEIYGRSPSSWVLPDIRMLNEMNRSIIRQAHKALDPPLMTTEDGALEPFDNRPGKMNPGTLNERGEPLVKPMVSGANFQIGLDMLQAKQMAINAAYYTDLFAIVAENPDITATVALEIAAERGMLLGPVAGRLTAECQGPLIHREIDLHARAGRFPPMPDEMVEAGGEYTIEYESPLARAQRAEEGAAIGRTYSFAMPLVEFVPEVLDNLDHDQNLRTIGEVNGMDEKGFRSVEAVKAIRDGRQKAQQTQQLAEAVPGVARGVKDLAQARAMQ